MRGLTSGLKNDGECTCVLSSGDRGRRPGGADGGRMPERRRRGCAPVRCHAHGGTQVPAGRHRGVEPDACRAAGAVRDALRGPCGGLQPLARSAVATGRARMGGGFGDRYLCGQFAARFSDRHEGRAAAACLAAPLAPSRARGAGGVPHAPPLGRHVGAAGHGRLAAQGLPLAFCHARRHTRRARPRGGAGARGWQLAASGLRWRVDALVAGPRGTVAPVAAGQLRV